MAHTPASVPRTKLLIIWVIDGRFGNLIYYVRFLNISVGRRKSRWREENVVAKCPSYKLIGN